MARQPRVTAGETQRNGCFPNLLFVLGFCIFPLYTGFARVYINLCEKERKHMFVISTGFSYIAFLMLIAGSLLALEKYSKWKVFNIVPPLVWIYFLNMVFSTMGVYSGEEIGPAYDLLKNNLLYAMVFVSMLRCDFRKLAKLGARVSAIFLGCSITLGIGTVLAYPLFVGSMGGPEKTWAAIAALYASWVGSSANMAAMAAVFESSLDAGAFGAALALDTVCYSVWIALLLLASRYASKWDNAVKADTSKLDTVAQATNAKLAKEKKRATSADWIFLIGLSMAVSSLSQMAGAAIHERLAAMGLGMASAPICATLFVTVLGLACALTPLGKLPALEELSSIYLYAVVSLLASQADLTALASAPMWILYGLVILAIHMVLMFILSKLFHWDLGMVSTASLANVGGAASAPIVATIYNPTFAGIGVLMGVLGAAIGNFFGLGMGVILRALFV